MEQIEYTTTLDCLVDFNVIHAEASILSPTMRFKAVRNFAFVGLAFGALLVAVTGKWAYLLAGVVGGVVGGLTWAPFQRQSIRKIARSLYSAPEGKSALGWHRLHLKQDGLQEESESGAQLTKYSHVCRILETRDYVLIYIGPLVAHVIRRARVTQGDVSSFVAALRARIGAG
jgi:hypothetical protein